jgi:hypothetical protein
VPLLGRRLERACRVDALRDTGHVRPFGDAVYEVPPGADGCFDTADGSWLIVQPKGRGEIVATGGATFLTNGGIAGADNAVLAVHLLTPGDTTRVEIVRPVLMTAGAGSPNLLDLVGEHVWAALWQVLIGFLVLAAWRARRLGRPLIDQAPVRLASSDLTAAVGALLARHDTRAATLQRVAGATRRRLARRLDLPDPVDADTLAEHVAARTSQDPTALRRVLDPPAPADDAALVRATTALSDLEQTLATRLQSTLEETDVR